jgi:leucyl aminopeptidase
MDNLNITISKTYNLSLGTTFIPILLTNIIKHNLFNILNQYIAINRKYINIIKHIEENIKANGLTLASVTIDTNTSTSTQANNKIKQTQSKELKTTSKITKKSHTKLSKANSSQNIINNEGRNLHQIYIVVIRDTTFKISSDKLAFELMENARISGNMLFQTLKTNKIIEFNIIDTSNSNLFINNLMEGLLLSCYKFLKYKTDKALATDKYSLKHINISSSQYKTNIKQTHAKHNITNLVTIIKSVFMARDLINEPANNNKATFFIDTVKKNIQQDKLPITMEIFDAAKLKKLGMGLILGVGQGSNPNNAPRMLILKYIGHGQGTGNDKSKDPDYVLLGKGITYDTGGLDLKPARSMLEMKTDLSGAATVVSFLLGYAKLKGSRSVYVVCPFAENSIGPNSIKPSDVLTAYNGSTVEITNTDAEGRLVLADSLAYVVDKYPNAKLIDFATLTGQQESLSCKVFSNILSSENCKEDISKLIYVGNEINEPLVELPLMESKFLSKLESNIADIKNVSTTCSADIILSAVFMKHFIKHTTQWIHIDIAGPSYKIDSNVKYATGEASGIGVRLLMSYFIQRKTI